MGKITHFDNPALILLFNHILFERVFVGLLTVSFEVCVSIVPFFFRAKADFY